MNKPTTWKCRDGRVLPIADMTTEHLRNTVNMLRRNGAVGAREAVQMWACPPQGEFAHDAWEDEIMALKISRHLDALETELTRRGFPK